ncbi:RNA polymerase sigma factor [Pantoea agglomerans]|jgi:RNA polymerase sigma-70 factor (ECF subfamily)|uniref:RNA polymerase sigma factor n=1 Tax=Enterobacter agglomerans TaxID=549 RepID=UPI002D79EF7C|nr:RNA polymerase sigma factor [Pantoea agglomerans]WRO92095.1 RNA polymerase sigma factor [Pantoea agglomerans]
MLSAVNTLEVFIKSRESIYRVAFYRTGTKQAAQDITQDICLKVMSLANEFPTHDDARNYLIRVAINASTDYVRAEKRHIKLLEGAAALFEDYGVSPEYDCQRAEDMSRIEKALEGLPAKCRDVLYLSRVEGMTHAEISAKLGVSRSLVEKYAIRALLHCRQYLNDK